jgi:hypothetical protein
MDILRKMLAHSSEFNARKASNCGSCKIYCSSAHNVCRPQQLILRTGAVVPLAPTIENAPIVEGTKLLQQYLEFLSSTRRQEHDSDHFVIRLSPPAQGCHIAHCLHSLMPDGLQ